MKTYQVWEKRGVAGDWKKHENVAGNNMGEAATNHARSRGYAAIPAPYTPGVYRVAVTHQARVCSHFIKVEASK